REVLEHRSNGLRRPGLHHERGEALPTQAECGQVQATLEEAHDRVVPSGRTSLGGEVRVERGYNSPIRRRTGGVGRNGGSGSITDPISASSAIGELHQAYVTDASLGFDGSGWAVSLGYFVDYIHLNVGAAPALDEVTEDQDVAYLMGDRTTNSSIHKR